VSRKTVTLRRTRYTDALSFDCGNDGGSVWLSMRLKRSTSFASIRGRENLVRLRDALDRVIGEGDD